MRKQRNSQSTTYVKILLFVAFERIGSFPTNKYIDRKLVNLLRNKLRHEQVYFCTRFWIPFLLSQHQSPPKTLGQAAMDSACGKICFCNAGSSGSNLRNNSQKILTTKFYAE